MGIQGLLSFLEKASRPVNISEFSGCTVAIDSYCWLHKGAFSCAEKLARGEKTDQYVKYCMKFVNMLQSFNIKPILVFDGRHLPAKAETEKKRRELRETNRKKAAELLRMERESEARSLIQRCIDVTHEMALALMQECRSQGVDCIVAPYEADAQLAFLNINGLAHLIITEDSDLMLFGCKLVIFKMDAYGNGMLVEQSKIPLAMKQHPNQFSMDKFRHMCILSGCDYLKSLPGIGLAKACKFFKKTQDNNISRALTRLGSYLNMPNLEVTVDYREKFMDADAMFKHQPVFDPRKRQVVPLTPLPPDRLNPLPTTLDPEVSYQLALGNLNPFNLQKVDSWDPDQPQSIRTTNWKSPAHRLKSIWSRDYELPKPLPAKPDPRDVKHPTTKGKSLTQPVSTLTQRISNLPARPSIENELARMRETYSVKPPPSKRHCLEESDSGMGTDSSSETAQSQEEPPPSPPPPPFREKEVVRATPKEDGLTVEDILFSQSIVETPWRLNPFQSKQANTLHSSPGGALDTFSKLKRTQVEQACVVQSRYFSSGGTPEVKRSPQNKLKNDKEDSHLNETLLEIINSTPSPKKRNSFPFKRHSFISPKKNLFEVIDIEDYEKNKELSIPKCKSPEKIKKDTPRKNVFSVTSAPKSASPNEVLTPKKKLFTNMDDDVIQEAEKSLCSPKQQSFLQILDDVSKEVKENKTETDEKTVGRKGASSMFKWKQPLLDNPQKARTENSLIGLYKPKPKLPVLSKSSPKTNQKKASTTISPRGKPSLPDNANFKQKPFSSGQPSLLNMFAFQPKPKLKTT